MLQKLVQDHFFILVNNPKQPLNARNSFNNKILWKGPSIKDVRTLGGGGGGSKTKVDKCGQGEGVVNQM